MRIAKLKCGSYIFKCPGCENDHMIRGWDFNENFDLPTFKTSVKVTRSNDQICHFWITDGNIMFLNNSTHKYKGRLMALNVIKEMPLRWRDRIDQVI